MLIARFDHDHFGMMPALHLLRLGDSLRSDGLWMLQNLIRHFVSVQTSDQLLWYFHNRLRGKVSLSGVISTLSKKQVDTAAQLPRRERIVYGYMRSLRE